VPYEKQSYTRVVNGLTKIVDVYTGLSMGWNSVGLLEIFVPCTNVGMLSSHY